ncbi:hypothetical protein ACCO45_000961 [Purpureocillium lilacinum]|uniref:Uncharacterized protein n=1 Tax=Purpureocillium lilacinum TaxID=33203 RepID=A0ACC4E6T8_PURLI
MLSQLSRASRATSAVAAVARSARAVQVRTFIAPTVSRRADFVQELYLKELKAYKVPRQGVRRRGPGPDLCHAQDPRLPEETDLAGNLKEYESMAVEIEGQDASAQAGNAAPALQDWLEAEEEEPQGH